MRGKNETAHDGGPTNATTQSDSSILDKVLSCLKGVKKTKDGYMALCPFHDDHNPSLMVFENGGFYCYGCDARGSIKHLARHLGIVVESDGQKDALKSFLPYLSKRLGINTRDVEKVAPRLNIRAKNGALTFDVVTAKDEYIGSVRHKPGDSRAKYELPAGVSMKGQLFGLDLALNAIKINRIKGIEKGLESNVLLTEGYFDALGFLAHDIPAAAIMGGLNSSEESIRKIYKTLFDSGFDRVVLCFDSDNTGQKFTLDYLRYFLSRPEIWTNVISLPDGFKDINEGLQQDGPAFFEKLTLLPPVDSFLILENIEKEIEKGDHQRHIALMKVARFYSEIHPVHRQNIDRETLIERLGASVAEWSALFEELPIERDKERVKNELAKEGQIFLNNIESDPVAAFKKLSERANASLRGIEKRKPVSVVDELAAILDEIRIERDGFKLHDTPGLDTITIQPVDLVTIGAGTGVGKTTFALNVADYFLRQDKRVLFVSYEINRGRVLSQLLAIRTNTKKNDVYRGLKQGAGVDPGMFGGLSIIADPAFTVEELARLVGKYKTSGRPLDLVIVDYDQLAQTEGRFDNEERRVAYISQTLKGVTLDDGVPVVLLSQISKDGFLRFSQQKNFDSSIVLKLKIPKELKEEALQDYYASPCRKVVVEIEKYRDGQAKREYEIAIDFETGRIESPESW